MTSHYGQYIKEREDRDIFENEHGFFTYKIFGDECYIVDMFIEKKFRRLGIATEMANVVEKIAKEHGCKFITGTCVPSTNGATESMKAMFHHGFKVHSCEQDKIILIKEL